MLVRARANSKSELLVATVIVAIAGCASKPALIQPGDRLEVRFGGPGSKVLGYSVTQLSLVDSNGVIRIGDCTAVRVQGMSTKEASKALCESLYVSKGEANLVQRASVRKIAPRPVPLALSVFQSEGSTLVFRLTNTTSNSFRLPSTGYVLSDFYTPANTDPAYARFDKPEVHIGLWLTRDWRHVGQDWMWASDEAWKERLKIQVLGPGEHLDVNRPFSAFAGDITSNTVFRFNFQISQEWAERYGLWEGNISVTGFTKETTK